jgi:hypothetical protein
MTYCKQTILKYKNISAKDKTRTAVLKALRAGRKPQETGRFLKVHRSLVYRLKKVLDQNQDAEKADVTPARKEHQIFSLRHGPGGHLNQGRRHAPPPPSLTRGQRVHAKQYIEVFDTVVKSWVETVAGECPYVFQQDRAPPTQPQSPRPV